MPNASDVDGSAILDFIGIGFGPSNLAVAVALQEIAPHRGGLFFESSPQFNWHEGLIFAHSRLQISFLKDLVTLRNPQSPYTFLNYLKSVGRLEHFANLREFHPHRREFLAYLRWVAAAFGPQVQYGTRVVSVRPASKGAAAYFVVEVEDCETGQRGAYSARSVIAATGGVPRTVEVEPPGHPRVIHASQLNKKLPLCFPNKGEAFHALIAGDGQSAGEAALEILRSYPRATVDMLAHGYSLHASDSTPFMNTAFSKAESAAFHAASRDKRQAILQDQRVTNYGVVDAAILRDLYELVYAAQVDGREVLSVRPFKKLVAIRETDHDKLVAHITDRIDGQPDEIKCDVVVLATGYERKLDQAIFAEVLPLLERSEDGRPVTSPARRAQTQSPDCGLLYLQGLGEAEHGISDSLLSMLAMRSAELAHDLDDRLGAAGMALPIAHPQFANAYPPAHHVETDQALLLELIGRFPFATFASAPAENDPALTQIPLVILPGDRPTLFGHLDRRNRQAQFIDGQTVAIVFHGADRFISPNVYTTSQLPTWNSLSVHVRGIVRILSGRDEVVAGLQAIARAGVDRGDDYALSGDDPRIDRLIASIVGFHVEITGIVGRFKLSQDRSANDQVRAATALYASAPQVRDLVEASLHLGCPVTLGNAAVQGERE